MEKRIVAGGAGEGEAAASDLAQLTRLALSGREDDVRLFAARLVRKYRRSAPALAAQLEESLKARPHRTRSPLRDATQSWGGDPDSSAQGATPPLLRTELPPPTMAPLLSDSVKQVLVQIAAERRQADRLQASGLTPTSSAIFVGPPGVGKTLSARWLAHELDAPLHVLDLTTVMSSYLGRSGSNLRSALDFARQNRCVLLLDEVDAIAKRRSDDSDVGELKRLVTIILQEVDTWPATSLLLATTNHPELIDPALWRRFDLVIDFPLPELATVEAAIPLFLGRDAVRMASWQRVLALLFCGVSLSDVEREVVRLRRSLAIGTDTEENLVTSLARRRAATLPHDERIELATRLVGVSHLSQHAISSMTGVSRDTIRKRVAGSR